MRDVIALGQIEAFPVLLVEVLDFSIGDRDFRRDLFVHELVDRDALPELIPDVINRHLLLFEQIFKLLFGVLAFELVEFDVDFGVRRAQGGSRGLLEQDLIVDHLIQNLEFQILGFFGGWWLFSAVQPVLKLLFQLGRRNVLVVDASDDIGRGFGCGATGRSYQQPGQQDGKS